MSGEWPDIDVPNWVEASSCSCQRVFSYMLACDLIRAQNACVRCCGYVVMERMLRIPVFMKSSSSWRKWGKSRSRIKALRQSIHHLQVEEKE